MPMALLQTELPPSNIPWLFAAFAASWAVFFLYAFFVNRRQQELQTQVRELQRALERQNAPEGELPQAGD